VDFLDFRDYLIPASGFQSLQFRLIENRLGVSVRGRPLIDGASYASRFTEEDRRRLRASETEPSLFDHLERWLERTPFLNLGSFDFWREYRNAVEAMLASDRRLIESNPTLSGEERTAQLKVLEATADQFDALLDKDKYDALVETHEPRLSHRALQAALLINLYRDEPILQLPFRLLTRLMDIDEGFTTWRYRHSLMALRMIGTKIGTGGTSGHEYLRRSAEQSKVFTDLFNLSTFFLPRSAIPRLPPEVERTMGFHFTGESD
ncbi:MAG: tryptophan 2,3-dioxygenase family protein, partial [Acidimicrobiia bacterium]